MKKILLPIILLMSMNFALQANSPKERINEFIEATLHPITAYDIEAYFAASCSGVIFGAESTTSTSDATQFGVSALDANHFVVGYNIFGGGPSGSFVIVGEVSGNSIVSYGTPIQFFSGFAGKVDVSTLSPTSFIVAFEGGSNFGQVVAGTVSGTTISLNQSNTVTFESSSTTRIYTSKVNTTQFLISYQAGGVVGKVVSGTVSGNTITLGTSFVFNGAGRVTTTATDMLNTTDFILVYCDVDNSSRGAALVGQLSGTSISFPSPKQIFSSGGINNNFVSAVAMSATEFLVAYPKNNASGHVNKGTVSGTSISITAANEIQFSSTWAGRLDMKKLAVDKFVIAYEDIGNSDQGIAIVGTYNSGTITINESDEVIFNTQDTEVELSVLEDDKLVLSYRDGNAKLSSIIGEFNGLMFFLCDVSATITNESCMGSNDGSIDLTVDGQGTFTYLWNDNVTTEDRTALATGIYEVTVTETNSGDQVIESFTVGKFSNGLSFDGVDDKVTVPFNAALNPTNAFTLEVWIKPTGFGAASFNNTILSTAVNAHGYILRCGGNGILQFVIGTGSAFPEITSPVNALTLNEWQHVAATYDNGVAKLYVDGVEVASTNSLGQVAYQNNMTNSLTIGESTGFAPRPFQGSIDEVRIFNRARSQTEIEADLLTSYTSDIACGLLAYYPTNDCTITVTLTDESINSNDGTIMGAAETPAQGAPFLNLNSTTYQVFYVNQAVVGGANDGSSWANAYANLQDALSNTTCADEIWVAQGTYYPDEGSGQTNDDRFATFIMQNDLGIYGGFDGTETIRSDQDFRSNETILNGDIDQNDNSGGDNSGNSVHVITNRANGVNATAILDGFTITAGNANAAGNFNASGGGMLNNQVGPTILNCLFEENEALFGGAVYNTNSNTTFSFCQFIQNTGTNQGGAMSNNASSSVTISNCLFHQNSSALGCMFNDSSSPTITNCTFSENSIVGAIYNANASPIISNSIIWNNDAGIVNSGTTTVTNSIVQGGFTGTGNKDQDPLFVDAANGDLRLQACSPAIDMGDNSANSTSEDLDGNMRVFNTTIDMGAYERQSVPSEMLAMSMQMATLSQANVTDYQVDCDNLIATVEQTGANAIDGDVTAFVFIDASVQQFNSIPYVQRHYEINPATDAATATGTVTLYFTQAEFDAFNTDAGSTLDLPTSSSDATGKANLRITKFSGTSTSSTGNPMDYNSGTELIDPDDTNIVWNSSLLRWEVTFETTGFSGFFVQTENTALPVELLFFAAEKVEAQSLLKWSTASEQNNLGFEIERAQQFAINNWETIGFVKGANTTLDRIDYKFYDEQPSKGVNYYRLKQMDSDGSFTYSEIRVVNFKKSNTPKIIIAPNPTDGILRLILPDQHEFETISVYNSMGHLVLQIAVQAELSLLHLADGLYWIRLENNKGASIIKKVLKQ